MLKFYPLLLLTLSVSISRAELCNLIEVGTSKDVNDAIKLGILQKKFDP